MGEVAERSEDGEGEQIDFIIQKRCFSHLAALGFACLHSLSPATPAAAGKTVCRWQRQTGFPLSVAFSDSSPKGRAKNLYPVMNEKWSVSLLIRSISVYAALLLIPAARSISGLLTA